MLKVQAIQTGYGQTINITGPNGEDFQTAADTDADPREHLRALAREYRDKARRAAEMAEFLTQAADAA